MPPLHYAAPSRPSLEHTLGCSNLWGSLLTSGDLHCSFAPAHLYQMISSSTSNLLSVIPHSQSTSTPPASCFLSFCHSSYPTLPHFCFLSPSSFSTPSLCLLRFAWVSFEMREQTEIGAKPSSWRVCACVCSIWHLSRSKNTKRRLVWLWKLHVPL